MNEVEVYKRLTLKNTQTKLFILVDLTPEQPCKGEFPTINVTRLIEKTFNLVEQNHFVGDKIGLSNHQYLVYLLAIISE